MRSTTETAGAKSPEELDSLFEDAFALRDGEAVGALFDPDGLVAPDAKAEVRGREQIRELVAGIWADDPAYTSEKARTLVAGDIALVIHDWKLATADGAEGARSADVLRRDANGDWRYVIALFDISG